MPDQDAGQFGIERHDGNQCTAKIQAAVQIDAAYVVEGDAGPSTERSEPLGQVLPQPHVFLHRPDAVTGGCDRPGQRAQPRSHLEHVRSGRNTGPLQQGVRGIRSAQEVLPKVLTGLESESGITVGRTADDFVHRQGLLDH